MSQIHKGFSLWAGCFFGAGAKHGTSIAVAGDGQGDPERVLKRFKEIGASLNHKFAVDQFDQAQGKRRKQ